MHSARLNSRKDQTRPDQTRRDPALHEICVAVTVTVMMMMISESVSWGKSKPATVSVDSHVETLHDHKPLPWPVGRVRGTRTPAQRSAGGRAKRLAIP